jgi:predicted Zn-dependent protease
MGRETTKHTKITKQTKRIPPFVCFVIFVCFVVSMPLAATAQSEGIERAATAAREANRVDEAIRLYREALKQRPKWDEGWFYLATLLYERDQFAESAEAFGRTTELSPKIGTAWVMRGLSEFKLGREEEALKHLQRGRELGITDNPNLRNVMLYHEGALLAIKGDFDGALRTLSLLAKDGVENEDLILTIGLAALRVRPSALEVALRPIALRTGRAEYWTMQKKFTEASDEYARLAKDFPKTPNVQFAYGRYLLASNHDDEAIVAFKREIENTPTHLLARLMIADAKLRFKDFAGGLPYAEQAVKLRPEAPIGHYLLGSLLLETGHTARAVTELETAERLIKDEPRIYFALGRAYARAGRKQDAERARAEFERLKKKSEDEKP